MNLSVRWLSLWPCAMWGFTIALLCGGMAFSGNMARSLGPGIYIRFLFWWRYPNNDASTILGTPRCLHDFRTRLLAYCRQPLSF